MHRKRIVFYVAAIALTLSLASCQALIDLIGDLMNKEVTIAERISLFQDMLNEMDRSAEAIQPHFHVTNTVDYDSIADPEVFESGPLSYANAPFTFTLPDPIEGTVITCTFENGSYATGQIVFTMELRDAESADYRIKRFDLTLDGDTTGTVYTIKYF